MAKPETQLIVALTISTFVTVLNIAAVSSGNADAYYTSVEQFLLQIIPLS